MLTDRELHREIRIAASEPMRFSDIAVRFYRNTKADENDPELWNRFWNACRDILEEVPNSIPMKLRAKPGW